MESTEKEFYFNGDSFTGVLLEDCSTHRIWEKKGSDGKLVFITTGLPSANQLVVFVKLGKEFVLLENFRTEKDVWMAEDNGTLSHYVPLLPYQAKALVVPYKVKTLSGTEEKIIVEFHDSCSFVSFWKFKEKKGDEEWICSIHY